MPKLSEHFQEQEFLCRHCGAGTGMISSRLIALLERTREIYGKPMRISSGFRCPAHNAAVGGVPTSAHLTGEAADVLCVLSGDRHKLLAAAYAAGSRRVGISGSFLHFDVSTLPPQDVTWLYGEE